MKITLDMDEREVVNSLMKGYPLSPVAHTKIIKYARNHGLDIGNQTFDYSQSTGEVICPSEKLEINIHK